MRRPNGLAAYPASNRLDRPQGVRGRKSASRGAPKLL